MTRLSVIFFFLIPLAVHADTFRSNGKGGGRWSDPATWEGGKVPVGGSISVLSKDVVDLDALAGNVLVCDELTVDRAGLLRVSNTNRSVISLREGLSVFGGLAIDLSASPEAVCEFQFLADSGTPHLLVSGQSKVLLKGASATSPNVAFRLVSPTNQPAQATPPKPVSLEIAPKTWFEAENVAFEGIEIGVRGVDSSGVKFNERFSLRGCRLVRSPIAFRSCRKIDIVGNHWIEAGYHAVHMESCSGMSFRSNTVERVRDRGLLIYASTDLDFIDNRFAHNGEGFHLTTCTDVLLQGNVHETNRMGMLLGNCTRAALKRVVFRGNDGYHLYAASGDGYRLYDCVFDGPPIDPKSASIFTKQKAMVEVVNTPRQSFALDQEPGGLAFCAYVDILVTNPQGQPLGRVPLRVRSGNEVVATSRTEAVGAHTGHTPLPSSHRPLVLPWWRYVPGGTTNPPPTCTYTVEADGTHMGYTKQSATLVIDESHLRADPDKPTQTLKIQLSPR